MRGAKAFSRLFFPNGNLDGKFKIYVVYVRSVAKLAVQRSLIISERDPFGLQVIFQKLMANEDSVTEGPCAICCHHCSQV